MYAQGKQKLEDFAFKNKLTYLIQFFPQPNKDYQSRKSKSLGYKFGEFGLNVSYILMKQESDIPLMIIIKKFVVKKFTEYFGWETDKIILTITG